ncbi:type IX secretion system protein PorQ [Neptunitalea lumnitzerae]|uniref:Penicillin-binding protein n=1 Tax=Neptunitalea lumnitzerae TaxID=2965509 RepID=A0ABQ5ML06_9FLAO|nr:type IX secretion system protein PorQ [Neptunitalea sp. Y10]GLB50058.1 penicillin-binding protein [Neptunitalea sp. Y10]
MQKALLTFFLVFSTLILNAQMGGRYTYQFLNLVANPRQAALGGKVITNYDNDVLQALTNPASVNNDMSHQLALSYVNYLGDVGYGSAAYAYQIDRYTNTIQGGLTYVNYGSFMGRDEFGNETGEFSGSETALSVGWAYKIPRIDLHIGFNTKLIYSTLESYNSFGGAFDVGLMYINDKIDFNAAIVVRNIGAQFTTYAGIQEPLPLEIDAGLSQLLEHVPIRWHLTFEDLQYWNVSFANPVNAEESLDGTVEEEKDNIFKEAFRHMVIGAEVFPEGDFNIRLGYNFRRAAEMRIAEYRTFSGFSGGFALKIRKTKVSYTFARYTNASHSSLLGLQFDLK